MELGEGESGAVAHLPLSGLLALLLLEQLRRIALRLIYGLLRGRCLAAASFLVRAERSSACAPQHPLHMMVIAFSPDRYSTVPQLSNFF
jgi:hypothetical protein